MFLSDLMPYVTDGVLEGNKPISIVFQLLIIFFAEKIVIKLIMTMNLSISISMRIPRIILPTKRWLQSKGIATIWNQTLEIFKLKTFMNGLARCQVEQLWIGPIVPLAFRFTRSDHNHTIFFSLSPMISSIPSIFRQKSFALSYRRILLSDESQKGINWMMFFNSKKLLIGLLSLEFVRLAIITWICVKRLVKIIKCGKTGENLYPKIVGADWCVSRKTSCFFQLSEWSISLR